MKRIPLVAFLGFFMLAVPSVFGYSMTLDEGTYMVRELYVQNSTPTQAYPNALGSGYSTTDAGRIQNGYSMWNLTGVSLPADTEITLVEYCGRGGGVGYDYFYATWSVGVYEVYNDSWISMNWLNQTCGDTWGDSANCNVSSYEDSITHDKDGWQSPNTHCWDITRLFKKEYNGDRTMSLGLHTHGYTSTGGSVGFTVQTVNITYLQDVDAEVVSTVLADYNPALDQEVQVRMKIKNTGNTPYDFVVGLSIGNSTYYCNKDCYTDGKGDYISTGLLAPNHTTEVERLFKFKREYFDVGVSYDIGVAVYEEEYMPPSEALDLNWYYNNVTISPIGTKLFGYARNVTTSKPTEVSIGDDMRVKAYIENNGSISWNFTVGLSIGYWSAVSGRIYTTLQPSLVPPCNTECYTDDRGSWVSAYIPPNYTAPIERKIEIPTYFLVEQPFDVGVGVWTKEPELGGELVSVVYIKNITVVSGDVSTEVATGEALEEGLDSVFTVFSTAFGVSETVAKTVLWLGLTVFVVYGVAKGGAEYGLPMQSTAGVVALIMFMMGGVIGWMPVWISLLLTIFAGFIVAKQLQEIFLGG